MCSRWYQAGITNRNSPNGSARWEANTTLNIAPSDQRCAPCDAELIRWAELHADVIRRFGRFPHRNAALGRATTPEEQAFSGLWWIPALS